MFASVSPVGGVLLHQEEPGVGQEGGRSTQAQGEQAQGQAQVHAGVRGPAEVESNLF